MFFWPFVFFDLKKEREPSLHDKLADIVEQAETVYEPANGEIPEEVDDIDYKHCFETLLKEIKEITC